MLMKGSWEEIKCGDRCVQGTREAGRWEIGGRRRENGGRGNRGR
jgi:hypothetical protein